MKKSLITTLLLAAGVVAYAQNETVALPFTRISQNAVASAMGGACLASTSSQGFFANPAMMAFSGNKGDFSLSGNYWQPSQTTYIDFSGALCLKQRIVVSLGASYGICQKYSSVSKPEMEAETFRPSDMIIGAGVGIKMGRYLAVGANLRYAGQTLGPEARIGTVGADILMSTCVKGFSATLGANNIGGKVAVEKNASTKYGLPASLDLGLGYKSEIAEHHKIEALADLGYYFHGDFYASLGASYSLMDIISLRAGYHYGRLIPSHGSIGLGGCYKGIRIDLAYLVAGKENPVCNTAVLSLGYRF